MSEFAGVVSLSGRPIEPGWKNALRSPFGSASCTPYDEDFAWLVESGPPDGQDAHGPAYNLASRGPLVAVASLRLDDLPSVPGVPFRTAQRQILLAATEADSADFPRTITGDFSAAIWDRSSRKLVCVRDHFGVRPFYYALHDDTFFFSTDIRGLTAIGQPLTELDNVRIAQFLEGFPTEEERTFFARIRRLPRASRLIADAGGVRVSKYWDPEHIDPRPLSAREDDLVAEFSNIFDACVRGRLDDRRAMGSLLSGGLDSSSVTCTARELMDAVRPLIALSAVFPGLEEPFRSRIDESVFIDAVCEIDGITSVRIEADRLSPLSALEEIVSIHGQPVDPPNAYLDLAMCRAAQEHGVDILLDGLEGDITISHGVHFLDELAHRGNWRRFLGEGEMLDERLGLNRDAVFSRYGVPHLAAAGPTRLLSGLTALVLSGRFRLAARSIRRRLRRQRVASGAAELRLISDALSDTVDWSTRVRAEEPQFFSSEREAHLSFLSRSYIPSVMEFTHANGRHFGVEVRHPMFDRRIVDFCVRLPATLKLREGWTRYILRAAMMGRVPDTVRWRPGKATLAPNFDLKMEQAGASMKELFDASWVKMGDFVEKNRLNTSIQRKQHRVIWPAVVLASFLTKDF